MRTTGGTDLIAGWLPLAATHLPAAGALALILVAAMAVTPFLNNAATVLVMAPIAASFAAKLSHNPDPFLMAVAIGAACDFLTPIGHQCNTLVMGPGGYRFGDYWRLGLPLSLIVLVAGVPLIMAFWPLGQLSRSLGLACRRRRAFSRAWRSGARHRLRNHIAAVADADDRRHVGALEGVIALLQIGPESGSIDRPSVLPDSSRSCGTGRPGR